MATPTWISKLGEKWNLKNTTQVILVLVVFACTGITVLLIKRPLLSLIAGEGGNTKLASVLYYIFILPIYNVLLLFFGFLFGQFSFFWEFEKRSFRKIALWFKRKNNA